MNSVNVVHVCDVYASGGSDNDVEAYAMSGAITNAIGKAASNLGFQESVYLGKRDHRTVGKRRPERVDGKSSTTLKASTPKATTAKTSPKPKVVDPALAGQSIDDEIVDDPQLVEPTGISPDAFVIPTGKRQGQKLGDQTLEVIQWYATSLKPSNDEQKKLQSAAQALVKVRSNGHEPVAA